MVRTRSGKQTSKPEKEEADADTPPSKSPTNPPKVTSKSTSKSKSTTKSISPKRLSVPPKVSWQYNLMKDLCFWKPSDNTFSLWGCIISVVILGVAGYSAYEEHGCACPIFQFETLVLCIHGFNVLVNFCNEFLATGHLTSCLLFIEGAVNIADVFIFLWIANISTTVFISLAVISTFNSLALNIRYKNQDNTNVRMMTYLALIVCFMLNHEFIFSDFRISTYFGLVFVSMLIDVLDFPDNYFDSISICEGLVIFSRCVGIYCLVTAQLLFDENKEYTDFENQMKIFFNTYIMSIFT